MTTSASGPQRLYLIQVATLSLAPLTAPVPGYCIQTGAGNSILIDSGLPANFQAPPNMPVPEMGSNVIEQLAMICMQSTDIDLLICTHHDVDHAGNLGAFPNAQLIAQHHSLLKKSFTKLISKERYIAS
jgi:N-acyl homoserine lactone hydrolase